MIYVTGDIHGEYWRCNDSYFPEQDEMTKNDYLIICGDFGGIWDPVEGISEKELFHWFENRPFTTLYIDGNHENFDRLYNYPVEEWHGGKVHKISPSVIHLMRGQIFTLDNMKIFTFGGAASHDISGGILAPSDPDFKTKELELRRSEKSCRINHFSWWAQELPTDEEIHNRSKWKKFHSFFNRISSSASYIRHNGKILTGNCIYKTGFTGIAQTEETDMQTFCRYLCI